MITGEDLMNKFDEQVKSLNVRFELDRLTSLSRQDNLFVAGTISENTIKARAVILAQGNRPRKLGVADEEKYLGRGLSVCSTCDGPLYRGKKVAVVGGGNSALQTAVEMSGIAKSVDLIVRSAIRADPIYVEKLKEKENISVHLPAHISKVHGDKFLTGVTLEKENGLVQDLELHGVFIEIGWLPNTDMVAGFVEMNDRKEIVIDVNCHTSVEGVFAAGDVTSIKSKQIIIAAGEGAKAALEAQEYLIRH
jgi:NADH-dependent peroxiredoxin subunit F